MVTQNTALGGGIGFIGFDIREGDGNTVIQNLAKNNTGQGFFMDDGSGFQVLSNTAKNNDDGIFMENGAINSTIIGNIALNNTDFDLIEGNTNCDNNQWIANLFRTKNEACIQ